MKTHNYLDNFRTYQLAVEFYRQCERLKAPGHIKSQLLRSSSSIALNLAEGSAKPTNGDKRRFYSIALGSLRESQAALDLANTASPSLIKTANILGAYIFKLRARTG